MRLVVFLVVLLAAVPLLPEARKWAFFQKFQKFPTSPSQAALPRTIDYVVTHRTHPGQHFTKVFDPFPGDHGPDCAGPDPSVNPLPVHTVTTSHKSRGYKPDKSFYVCKGHLMTALGDVEGYSVSAWYPKQEFDFKKGGTLAFDMNIDRRQRNWVEVLITPRAELKVGSAHEYLPIDEKYPRNRILFDYFQSKRSVQVGTGAVDPDGIVAEQADYYSWDDVYPDDPANFDRRIRRKMIITFTPTSISWKIEKEDGKFTDFVMDVPGGLPFTRGMVVFKTHSYTPKKDGNLDNYSWHFDNVRFTGPVVGRYKNFEASKVIYLQANGDRQVGESQQNTIRIRAVGKNPYLFGQVHSPIRGEVLLSINGADFFEVRPTDYDHDQCYSTGWKSFMIPLPASALKAGRNTFLWKIGQRVCDSYTWIGFSVKSLELQFDK